MDCKVIAILISGMKVLDPKEMEERRNKRVKKHIKKRRKRIFLPLILFLLAVYVVGSLVVPLPPLQMKIDDVKPPTYAPATMPWPRYGQTAIGAVGYGLLEKNGEEKPLPTASMAKVITAVAVLKVKPIEPGAKPEVITLTAQDEVIYNQYLEEGQSVVPVEAGEQLTQYQALQALLLPSANNMANTLVRWAFGSEEEYLAFVNPFVLTLGMNNTRVADSSGFSPKTVSTAVDLTKLAEIAMNHPVVAEIVGQQQADLPVAGTVYNYNKLLGQEGIIGIKTGTTDEAGGCFLFSAKRKIDEHTSVTVVGAIMGAPNRAYAIEDARPLLDEAFKNFKIQTPIQTNQVVGTITQSGGRQVPVLVRQGIRAAQWVAQPPRIEVIQNTLTDRISEGAEVGKIKVQVGNMTHEVPLTAGGTIQPQPLLWRLRHAAGYL